MQSTQSWCDVKQVCGIQWLNKGHTILYRIIGTLHEKEQKCMLKE